MSDPFTQEAIKYLNAHGLQIVIVYTGFAIAIWTGGTVILAWVLSHRQTLSKLRLEGIEARLKSGEIVQQLEVRRKLLSDALETQNLMLRSFGAALVAKDAPAIRAEREELCRFHGKEYHDSLFNYLEICVVYLTKPDFLDQALLHFLPALDSKVRFLSVINSANALSRCGNPSPLKLQKIPVVVFLRRLRRSMPLHSIPSKFRTRIIYWQLRRHFRK